MLGKWLPCFLLLTLRKKKNKALLQINTELKKFSPCTVVLFLNAVVPNQSHLNSFLKTRNSNVTDSVMQNIVSTAPASRNKKTEAHNKRSSLGCFSPISQCLNLQNTDRVGSGTIKSDYYD